MKFLVLALCITLCVVPSPVFSQDAIGLASWYGSGHPKEDGKGLNYYTTSKEPFDPTVMACAHRFYPFGTILKVTNLKNGKSVHVRVNDRGPSKRYPNRIVDLTREAFRKIASLHKGKIPVKVELVNHNTVRDQAFNNTADTKENIIQKCTKTVQETFLKALLSCLSCNSESRKEEEDVHIKEKRN